MISAPDVLLGFALGAMVAAYCASLVAQDAMFSLDALDGMDNAGAPLGFDAPCTMEDVEEAVREMVLRGHPVSAIQPIFDEIRQCEHCESAHTTVNMHGFYFNPDGEQRVALEVVCGTCGITEEHNGPAQIAPVIASCSMWEKIIMRADAENMRGAEPEDAA